MSRLWSSRDCLLVEGMTQSGKKQISHRDVKCWHPRKIQPCGRSRGLREERQVPCSWPPWEAVGGMSAPCGGPDAGVSVSAAGGQRVGKGAGQARSAASEKGRVRRMACALAWLWVHRDTGDARPHPGSRIPGQPFLAVLLESIKMLIPGPTCDSHSL